MLLVPTSRVNSDPPTGKTVVENACAINTEDHSNKAILANRLNRSWNRDRKPVRVNVGLIKRKCLTAKPKTMTAAVSGVCAYTLTKPLFLRPLLNMERQAVIK
jgi:hypothetical protein